MPEPEEARRAPLSVFLYTMAALGRASVIEKTQGGQARLSPTAMFSPLIDAFPGDIFPKGRDFRT